MAKVNTSSEKPKIYTHEGARAVIINPEMQLRRSVMACMLWENAFYESGEEIAERIKTLVATVAPEKTAQIAIEAREEMKLRHVPLLLARYLAKQKYDGTAKLLERVIQRADELAEFLAIYWKDIREPLSAQVKKGLAGAFRKFDEYQLSKYNRDEKVKLRDVLFLCHAKPKDKEQADVWKRLVEGKLQTPDTWEVALSAGGSKKENWTRLLSENKLGGFALIRNLRNMIEADIDKSLVASVIGKADFSRVLPFRFIAAAKAAPQFEVDIDSAMLRTMAQMPKLPGKTVLVIDVSGSMYHYGNVSAKSDMNRALAACALGAITRELCEDSAIYATAGNDHTRIHQTTIVPSRHGMALVDAIYGMSGPLGGGGIFLNQVCNFIREKEKTADRTIVITDEQDCGIGKDDAPSKAVPLGKGYLLNVSVEKNGIGYKPNWMHIDGWSEAVINYIMEYEKSNNQI